jgi:hypothetical protein
VAIDSLDALIAALPNAQILQFERQSWNTGGTGIGRWHSSWTVSVSVTPPNGLIPTTAAICNRSLLGALPFRAPTGDARTYLAQWHAFAGFDGSTLLLVDRLGHMGGMVANSAADQTVNLDLTGVASNLAERRGETDYSDVLWFVDITAQIGTTARTLTITYTDGLGTPNKTTTMSLGGSSPINQVGMYRIVPSNGDSISIVQKVALSASTGSQGAFGITAFRSIYTYKSPTGTNTNGLINEDWVETGLPRIYDDSCLHFIAHANSTSSGPSATGHIMLVQG